MPSEEIRCGQSVLDTLSGLEGVVVARTEWLYGCIRLAVQPSGSKDGKPYEPFWVDEPQVKVVETPLWQEPEQEEDSETFPARVFGPRQDPKGPRPSENGMW